MAPLVLPWTVDRAGWDAAVRDCYTAAGLRWPGAVEWLPSPGAVVGAVTDHWYDDFDGWPLDPLRFIGSWLRIAALAAPHRWAAMPASEDAAGRSADAVLGLTGVVSEFDGLVSELAWQRFYDGTSLPERPGHFPEVYRRRIGPFGGRWDLAALTLRECVGWSTGWQAGDRPYVHPAFLAAQRHADCWWPAADVVLTSEPPIRQYREPAPPDASASPGNAERPGGLTRLHRADGPAIEWADGFGVHYWHGTRVPRWVIEAPTVAAIHAEHNAQIRRCALESFGWPRYLAQTSARRIDTAPDPGNPQQILELYTVPGTRPRRLLMVTDGTPDAAGSRRTAGLFVPASQHTALAAAAWTYGLTETQYATLQRRT